MTEERWKALMMEGDARLSPSEVAEVAEGWHWCPEWDYLLIGPGMEMELSCCHCNEVEDGQ